MRQLIIILFCINTFSIASAQDKSTISIPISAKLEAIASLVERELDGTVVASSVSRTCVEPKQACTKVPEFRGFKVTMKNRCVEVTPRVDCTIDQKVVRTVPIRISGSNDAVVVSQALQGSATVRGRGEVGRHIRETATGAADMAVTIAPVVNRDWSIGVARTPGLNVTWTQRPTARLFGNFPVTFTQDADRAIHDAFNAFVANDLPVELQKIDLKSHVAPIWNAMQQPVPVDLPGGDTLFIGFNPEGVALAPLRMSGGLVSTTLSLTGKLDSSSDANQSAPSAVPNLSDEPEPAGFSLSLPLRLDMSLLSNAASSGLPVSDEFQIAAASGKIEILSAKFLNPENGRLVVLLETMVTVAGLPQAPVKITMTGKPAFNQRTTTLTFEDSELQADGSGAVGTFLAAIANSRIAKKQLAELAQVSLGPEFAEIEKRLTAALTRELGRGIQTDANLSLTLDHLEVTETLNADVLATGHIEVTVLELN